MENLNRYYLGKLMKITIKYNEYVYQKQIAKKKRKYLLQKPVPFLKTYLFHLFLRFRFQFDFSSILFTIP